MTRSSGTSQEKAEPAAAADAGSWRAAALAPFRHRIFLAIWTATLISNFGSLIQAVGASWLMTSLAPSPDMVALVQASTALPIMLLSLPAGAIADTWNRRGIMLVAQGLMLAVSAALAILAFMNAVTAWSLLALTFLLGCGTALYAPAWQSSVGEQVPRSQIGAAVSLNSVGFNIARTLGPAIGGLIVASVGPQGAFIVNSLSYVALIAVLAAWRRPDIAPSLPPESLGLAVRTGIRYARLSPSIRAVLFRTFLFGLAGSAVWALMPLIARDLVGGGALTYGILFGSLGAGAVVGALAATSMRTRFPSETVVRIANLAFAAAIAAAALSAWTALTMLALAMVGASWVLTLSTFNVTVQFASPRWVVGRTIAIYQMLTFGGMALGSAFWGVLAEHLSLRASLMMSAVMMVAAAALGLRSALAEPERINLDPSKTWIEPRMQFEVEPESGPIVVTVEYRVASDDYEAFVHAMQEMRRIRRRDGARAWTLMQDMAQSDLWVERFHVATWVEHLRLRHRFTIADREAERQVLGFHRGSEAPRLRHLLVRRPDTVPAGRPSVVTDPNLPGAAVASPDGPA